MAANRIRWNLAEENFVTVNWPHMSITQLTEAFNAKFKTNVTKRAVETKIDKLNLPNKREYRRNNGVNEESALEAEGRQKTERLLEVIKDIRSRAKLKIKDEKGKYISGKVIYANDRFVTLESNKHRDTFLYTDFYTNRVVLA